MAGAIRVEIRGLKELQAKCRGKPFVAEEAKKALVDIGQIGLAAARRFAPVGPTGKTRSMLSAKVNAGPTPRWAVIKTDATATPRRPRARRGKTRYPYSYPKRLEFDPKSKHRDWLKRAIDSTRSGIDSALSAAARRIEARWSV